MTMPTKITFAFQGLKHELAHKMPIGTEFKKIDTEFAQRPLIVLKRTRTVESMVKAHDERLQPELTHNMVQGERRVFSTTKGNDAVVITRAFIRLDEALKLLATITPIDFRLFKLSIATHIAHSFVIKDYGFVRFRQRALRASTE